MLLKVGVILCCIYFKVFVFTSDLLAYEGSLSASIFAARSSMACFENRLAMSMVGLLGQNRLINTVATAAIRPTATLTGPAHATPPAAKNQVITPVNKHS